MKQPNDFKHYIGDCNLEYGGLFVNLEDFRDGYAECLRITDLDSACGFNNTVMVERITVLFDTAERVKDALACCGLTFEDLRKMPIESRKMAIVDACASYGHYDLVSDYGGDHRWIVKTWDAWDKSTSFDGWQATNMIGYYKKTTKNGIEYSCHQDIMSWLYYNGMLVDYN